MGVPEIRFEHGTWEVRRVRRGSPCLPASCDGETDDANKEGPKRIYIADDLEDLGELETFLHESAHAADPRACEEAIEEQARVQAAFIWEHLGWRPKKAKPAKRKKR